MIVFTLQTHSIKNPNIRKMNHKLIIRSLSGITFLVALMFLVSLIVQCASAPQEILFLKWAMCILVALLITLSLFLASKNYERNIFTREVLAIIGLGLFTAIAVGMLPYLILIDQCSLADAFFESASGFTTTGSTAFENLSKFPDSLIFYRGMTQCIGGMVTIFFFAILLPIFGAKTKSICMSGLSVRPNETSFATIHTIIKYVLGIYSVLIISSAVVFHFGGMTKLDAFCYAASIASTGGFSTPTGSKIFLESSALQYFSMLIMLVSGMNFIALMKVVSGNIKELGANEELRWYFGILGIATVLLTLFFLAEFQHATILESFRSALFHVTSLVTTTGLTISDASHFSTAPKVVLLFLMLCGGCSGSTAGGLKISRILITCKICIKNMQRSFRPNVISTTFLSKKQITPADESETLEFIVLAGVILAAVSLFLAVVVKEASVQEILSSACSNFFNVGVTFFQSLPSYASMRGIAKFLYGALMIIGRVEIYAITALFFPLFWKNSH
jgi:trk system potassium uptake protein TrkH